MKRWLVALGVILLFLVPVGAHLLVPWGDEALPGASGGTALGELETFLAARGEVRVLETSITVLDLAADERYVLILAGLQLDPDPSLAATIAAVLERGGTVVILDDRSGARDLLPGLTTPERAIEIDPAPLHVAGDTGDTTTIEVTWINEGRNRTLRFQDPAALVSGRLVRTLASTAGLAFVDHDGDGYLDLGEEGTFTLAAVTEAGAGRLLVIGDRGFLGDDRPSDNREFLYHHLAPLNEAPVFVIYGIDRGAPLSSSILRTLGLAIEVLALGSAWTLLLALLVLTLVLVAIVPMPHRFRHLHSLAASSFPRTRPPGASALRESILAKIALYHNIPVSEFSNMDPERQRLFVPDERVWRFLSTREDPGPEHLVELARRVRHW